RLLLPHLPPQWRRSRAAVVHRLYSVILHDSQLKAAREAALLSGIKRFTLLYADHVRVARSLEGQDILRAFETDVQMYVAEHSPHYVFIHAGVVGWCGRAIVLPGRSFAG